MDERAAKLQAAKLKLHKYQLKKSNCGGSNTSHRSSSVCSSEASFYINGVPYHDEGHKEDSTAQMQLADDPSTSRESTPTPLTSRVSPQPPDVPSLPYSICGSTSPQLSSTLETTMQIAVPHLVTIPFNNETLSHSTVAVTSSEHLSSPEPVILENSVTKVNDAHNPKNHQSNYDDDSLTPWEDILEAETDPATNGVSHESPESLAEWRQYSEKLKAELVKKQLSVEALLHEKEAVWQRCMLLEAEMQKCWSMHRRSEGQPVETHDQMVSSVASRPELADASTEASVDPVGDAPSKSPAPTAVDASTEASLDPSGDVPLNCRVPSVADASTETSVDLWEYVSSSSPVTVVVDASNETPLDPSEDVSSNCLAPAVVDASAATSVDPLEDVPSNSPTSSVMDCVQCPQWQDQVRQLQMRLEETQRLSAAHERLVQAMQDDTRVLNRTLDLNATLRAQVVSLQERLQQQNMATTQPPVATEILNETHSEAEFMSLQHRLMSLQDAYASLEATNARLERDVLQLDGETHTIAEYVLLYREQRERLRSRAVHLQHLATRIATARDFLRENLEKLHDLVRREWRDGAEQEEGQESPLSQIMEIIEDLRQAEALASSSWIDAPLPEDPVEETRWMPKPHARAFPVDLSSSNVSPGTNVTVPSLLWMDLVVAVGWFASICSTIQYILFLGIVRMIRKRGHANDLSLFPYVVMSASCTCWLLYGILKEDMPLSFVCLVGLLCNIMVVTSFFVFSIRKSHIVRQTLVAILMVAPIALYVKISWVHEVSRPQIMHNVSLYCACMSVVSYASPLVAISDVIRLKSTHMMSFSLVLSNLFIALLWVWYGVLSSEIGLIISNTFGVCLSVLQLFLFFLYPTSPQPTQSLEI